MYKYQGTLTQAGAERIGRVDLVRKRVDIDQINERGVAVNVFFGGSRICGILSTEKSSASEPGLVDVIDYVGEES